MKQYISTICLLLVALVLVGADQEQQEEGVKRQAKFEDWEPILKKVYATDGEFVKREKVAELLKELQKIFEPLGEEETNLQKSKINKLIEVSIRDVQKCSRLYLRNIHDLVDDNFRFKNSIWPYLNHHFYEYVSFCEKHVLHTNVASIKEEHMTGMQELASLLTKVEVGGFVMKELSQVPLSLDHLREGILIFLQHNGDGKLGIDSSFKFSALFETRVMGMCRAWIKATDSARAMNEFYVSVDFDTNETKWLEYGTLCHTIEMSASAVVPMLYRRFKKLNPVSRFKGLKSKLKKINCLDKNVLSVSDEPEN